MAKTKSTQNQKIKPYLLPPCSYQGGKQHICKEIVDYIYKTTAILPDTKFYDLCCGSGAVTLELINRGVKPENIIMLDIGCWGSFWKSVGLGVFDLNKFKTYIEKIPKDKFLIQSYICELSQTSAVIDEPYKYILLQAASFGGKQIWRDNDKWQNTSFRNYWQPTETSNRRSPVNPMSPMPDEIFSRTINIVNQCKGITCYNKDIKYILDVVEKENAVIYIDPPYTKTTKYGYNFDYEEFLSLLFDTTLSPIFVSEKESISDESIKLNFSKAKGGISGNRKSKNDEWLNVYR